MSEKISRRRLLRSAPAAAALPLLALRAGAEEPAATKKRIKQSLVNWCYKKYWNVDEMCQFAKGLGCFSAELVDPADFPTLKKHHLVCAIAGSHWFDMGMN